MRNKTLLAAGLLALSTWTSAQTGGISQQMLGDMERAQQAQPQNKAIFNALASNKIDDLARSFLSQLF